MELYGIEDKCVSVTYENLDDDGNEILDDDDGRRILDDDGNEIVYKGYSCFKPSEGNFMNFGALNEQDYSAADPENQVPPIKYTFVFEECIAGTSICA